MTDLKGYIAIADEEGQDEDRLPARVIFAADDREALDIIINDAEFHPAAYQKIVSVLLDLLKAKECAEADPQLKLFKEAV